MLGLRPLLHMGAGNCVEAMPTPTDGTSEMPVVRQQTGFGLVDNQVR